MLPVTSIRQAIADLLAADTTTFAQAVTAVKLALVKNDFTEDENLVMGDFTKADFDGYADIAGVLGAQQVGIDPNTNEFVLTIKEPAGGWRWECTGGTGLPQSIYGFICFAPGGSGVLLCMKRFDEAIAITASGQYIDIGNAEVRFVLQPMS